MAQNRKIYNVLALYAGPAIATGTCFSTGGYGNVAQQNVSSNRIGEVHRVQSFSTSNDITRKAVNQYGELPYIDLINLDQPKINATFEYLVNDFSNEKLLGFTISSGSLAGAISGILTKVSDDRNLFLTVNNEGYDVLDYPLSQTDVVIGLGNAFISQYTHSAQVGDFPKTSVTFDCLNTRVYSNSTGQPIPAIFPSDGTSVSGNYFSLPVATQSSGGNTINANPLSQSVLRPGDIQFNLGTSEILADFTPADLAVQSYSLSFNLNRQDLLKLGSRFSYSKEINFPVEATLNVNLITRELISGNLVDVINNNTTYNPSISIYRPGTTTTQCWYQLAGAKLQSMKFNSSIGSNSTIDVTFQGQIGGPNSQSVNLFMSGIS